jgi:hypothetical protein
MILAAKIVAGVLLAVVAALITSAILDWMERR